MRRLALITTIATLVACGPGSGTDTTETVLLSIAGTYNVTAVAIDTGGGDLDNSGDFQGTITLNAPSPAGAFTGSYTINAASGTLSGNESATGSLAFTSFGAPGVAPLERESFMEQQFPKCAWRQASAGQMNGFVAPGGNTGTPTLTVSGSVNVECPEGLHHEVEPSVATFSASGPKSVD
jgi:hypothetical protein